MGRWASPTRQPGSRSGSSTGSQPWRGAPDGTTLMLARTATDRSLRLVRVRPRGNEPRQEPYRFDPLQHPPRPRPVPWLPQSALVELRGRGRHRSARIEPDRARRREARRDGLSCSSTQRLVRDPLRPAGGHSLPDRYVVVTDVFGVETLVQRAEEAAAGGDCDALFHVRLEAPTRWPLLAAPPTAAAAAQPGPVLEEVRYLRDEMANFVWGSRAPLRTVWRALARPRARPGAEGGRADRDRPRRPPGCRPRTALPHPDTGARELDPLPAGRRRPGQGHRAPGAKLPATRRRGHHPGRRILQAIADTSGRRVPGLRGRGAPRGDSRVARSVRARWTDGSTHLWIARRKEHRHERGRERAAVRRPLFRPASRRTRSDEPVWLTAFAAG